MDFTDRYTRNPETGEFIPNHTPIEIDSSPGIVRMELSLLRLFRDSKLHYKEH